MTRKPEDAQKFVQIVGAGVDRVGDRTVIRGRLTKESLKNLLVDPTYQREVIRKESKVRGLRTSAGLGVLTDIVLGMRGERFERQNGTSVLLLDPVYIIDGLQRLNGVQEMLLREPDATPLLGAMIYVGTDQKFEKDRFDEINTMATRVSASILLRNKQDEIPVVRVLHLLTARDKTVKADKEMLTPSALAYVKQTQNLVIEKRISWAQNPHSRDLMSAGALLTHLAALHRHVGEFSIGKVADMATDLQKVYEKIGAEVFIDNLRTFFDFVDASWKLADVVYRGNATHIRMNFLTSLGIFFSDHINFWDGNRLVIPRDMAKRFEKFPLKEPQVVQASRAVGARGEGAMRNWFVEFYNKGKQTQNRLVSRYATPARPVEAESKKPDQGAQPAVPTTDVTCYDAQAEANARPTTPSSTTE